jgi:hypothetical protein
MFGASYTMLQHNGCATKRGLHIHNPKMCLIDQVLQRLYDKEEVIKHVMFCHVRCIIGLLMKKKKLLRVKSFFLVKN